MDGYDAFQYYMALKLHFSKDSFDVFKTPKIKCTPQIFEKRNDRFLFEKIAKKHPVDRELIQYYVANFAYGNTNFVYNEEESISCYFEWVKRKESMTKLFSDDIDRIVNYVQKNKFNKEEVLNFTFGTPSVILSLYLGKHISIETVRIIDDFLGIIDKWKSAEFTTSFWDSDICRIAKLKRFIRYDVNRIKPIIDSFEEELNEL